MSPISRCSPMWAMTSSSEMWPTGLKSAMETSAGPRRSRAAASGGPGGRPRRASSRAPREHPGDRDREYLDRSESAGDVGDGEGHGGSLAADRERRRDPLPPIGSYGFLSDCHTAALVSYDGSVEWLCLPRFDSPSAFAALLDRDAGHFRLEPARGHRADQPPLRAGDAGDRDDLGHRHGLGRRPRRADDRRVGAARRGPRPAADRTRVRPLAAADDDLHRRRGRDGDGVPAALRLRRRGGELERRRTRRGGRQRRRRDPTAAQHRHGALARGRRRPRAR